MAQRCAAQVSSSLAQGECAAACSFLRCSYRLLRLQRTNGSNGSNGNGNGLAATAIVAPVAHHWLASMRFESVRPRHPR